MKNKVPGLVLLAAVIVAVSLLYRPAEKTFSLRWNSLGEKLLELGVIDEAQASPEMMGILKTGPKTVELNSANSGAWLNILWALGLGNKNEILEEGPMMDERYGGAGNFASTGGWTLAKGGAMDHFSRHELITLTEDQQVLVQKVSDKVFRPCCSNPASFPDCNHGMAMLALIELGAAQGLSESKLMQMSEQANALWFPPAGSSCSA